MKTRDWFILFILYALLSWCAFGQQGLRSGSFVAGVMGGTGAAASFTPSDISGMQLWFKGESFAGLSEWASISNWPSSAPDYASRYATNSDYSQWPYLTNTFGSMVGTSALYFAAGASYDFLNVSNALAYSKNIASCTVVVVGHAIANSDQKIAFYVAKGTDAASTRHVLHSFSDEHIYAGGRTADADGLVMVSNNVPVTTPIIMQGDFLHSDGDLKLYTNGVLAAQNTSWQDNENTSNTDSLAVKIGISSTSPWLGWITEIIVYVPAISEANRTSLTTHLKTKFGL